MRQKYFKVRDEVAKDLNIDKKVLHEMAKLEIFPLLSDATFWEGTDRLSTKSLSVVGWEMFLNHFLEFSFNSWPIKLIK